MDSHRNKDIMRSQVVKNKNPSQLSLISQKFSAADLISEHSFDVSAHAQRRQASQGRPRISRLAVDKSWVRIKPEEPEDLDELNISMFLLKKQKEDDQACRTF